MKSDRRWLGERRGRPIFWAGALGIAVAVALLLAIVDPAWRTGLKDFQIALGGLGALAAALAQHDGATAAVREARRKEKVDRQDLHRKLIIQCRLDAFHLHRICAHRAEVWSKTHPRNNDDVLKSLTVVPDSPAIEEAWERVTLFSEEVSGALSNMLLHIRIIANIRVACTAYVEAPTADKTMDSDGVGGLVQTLRSTADAAEKLAQAMATEAEIAKKTASQ